CPHTVRSTHAGGLFHSFWFASMSVFIRGGHDNGTVLLVRGLPGSSIRLPPLRPWPNLLCRRLCTRSASALSARSRPALSGNRPRAHETCGAQQAIDGLRHGAELVAPDIPALLPRCAHGELPARPCRGVRGLQWMRACPALRQSQERRAGT